MGVSEEPACIFIFRQNPVWPPCNLRSAVLGPLIGFVLRNRLKNRKSFYQRGQCLLFSVVFAHSPLATPAVFISLLLANTVPPVRACLIIWWERFRRIQKEDDRGPGFNILNFSFQTSAQYNAQACSARGLNYFFTMQHVITTAFFIYSVIL